MNQQTKIKFSFTVPSPFEIAILLSVAILIGASFSTPFSLMDNMLFWGESLWSLLSFMAQMSLILLSGFVLAVSKPVQRWLGQVATVPRTLRQAYLLTFFLSALACWINWGLGLVVSAFLARQMAMVHRKIDFPLLVATSYMGFLFWHGGLSGSIPLVVSTPGHFSEKWVGGVIPLEQTLFSFFNLSLIFVLFSFLSLFIIFLAREKKVSLVQTYSFQTDTFENKEQLVTFSMPWLYWVLVALFVFYMAVAILRGSFQLSLNQMIFLFTLSGLLAHQNLSSYVEAVRQGCEKLSPILIQYPLYAGIMGVMIESGLAANLSHFFVQVSSQATFPVYMFWSAGLVNLFVPSGGGQWAVQAPVVIAGAQELGVPLWKVVLAVSWGDAWTNLAQPFWALPLLSLVGLGLQPIVGFCLKALVLSGVVISLFFFFV